MLSAESQQHCVREAMVSFGFALHGQFSYIGLMNKMLCCSWQRAPPRQTTNRAEKTETMEIKIREEKHTDHKAVFALIEKAFEKLELSDHREQFLVQRLRKSPVFIPELSMVAETENKIVGHILLTKLKIKNGQDEFDSLALAPVSVLPEYQGKGIGRMLIEEAHKKASRLGHRSIVLLGHEKYYPKFGYKRADHFGIELPFDVPKENCMAIELTENGLEGVSGTVEYPIEFNE